MVDQHVVVGLHDVQEHPYRSEICLAGVEVMLAVDSMERARMVCEEPDSYCCRVEVIIDPWNLRKPCVFIAADR